MNDKELLQQIKNRINGLIGFEEAPDNAMYYMRKDQIVWLISQAEKVEQLQQETEKEQKRLRNQIYETVEEKFLLEKQLQQAQAKIERCKEIFKDIREASSDIYALRKAEQALQALEGVK
ncbi:MULTISPECIES: hypothetical protein [Geobacillus]|uniref:hypothetical protein n=1 Tax=Geobacillus TaxID=129337 RepID=UPI0006E5F6FE|nr:MULTISPECIES: hypothetical protein [Geobacillus]KQB91900.1 hypothetical protein GEPA3_3039 [Geobacillus sp. PA-3]MED4916732.1 hypothetical protein [Geobacillus thermodenitrificans]